MFALKLFALTLSALRPALRERGALAPARLSLAVAGRSLGETNWKLPSERRASRRESHRARAAQGEARQRECNQIQPNTSTFPSTHSRARLGQQSLLALPIKAFYKKRLNQQALPRHCLSLHFPFTRHLLAKLRFTKAREHGQDVRYFQPGT